MPVDRRIEIYGGGWQMRLCKWLGSFLVLILTWVAGTRPVLAGGALSVGVAEADITPPKGFPVCGYYHERLATGTRDPLKARAFVFRSDKVQAAVVSCD